jgi:hypothetical protein
LGSGCSSRLCHCYGLLLLAPLSARQFDNLQRISCCDKRSTHRLFLRQSHGGADRARRRRSFGIPDFWRWHRFAKLCDDFPDYRFRVYVTRLDDPIIRFHRVREHEPVWITDEKAAARVARGDIVIFDSATADNLH